jgi:hypothetical protein
MPVYALLFKCGTLACLGRLQQHQATSYPPKQATRLVLQQNIKLSINTFPHTMEGEHI